MTMIQPPGRVTTIPRRTHDYPMNTTTISAVATALCLAFTACDSKEEKARKAELEARADSLENKADAVRTETKTEAKNMEKISKLRADADKEAAEKAAKDLKKSGEANADAIEEKAKQVRDAK